MATAAQYMQRAQRMQQPTQSRTSLHAKRAGWRRSKLSKAHGHLLSGCTLYLSDPAFSCHQKQRETTHHRQMFTCVQMHAWLIRPHSPLSARITSKEGGPCPPTRRVEIERLAGGPLPIIDEAHGEWRTGQGVSERLREGNPTSALHMGSRYCRT